MAVAQAPPRRKLVTIEDSTIVGMATSERAVLAFPFLAPLARQLAAERAAATRSGGRQCGRCGARKKSAEMIGKIKGILAGLDTAKRDQLKQLLNAEKVRIMRAVTDPKTRQRRVVPLDF
jgi:hypothetical protein